MAVWQPAVLYSDRRLADQSPNPSFNPASQPLGATWAGAVDAALERLHTGDPLPIASGGHDVVVASLGRELDLNGTTRESQIVRVPTGLITGARNGHRLYVIRRGTAPAELQFDGAMTNVLTPGDTVPWLRIPKRGGLAELVYKGDSDTWDVRGDVDAWRFLDTFVGTSNQSLTSSSTYKANEGHPVALARTWVMAAGNGAGAVNAANARIRSVLSGAEITGSGTGIVLFERAPLSNRYYVEADLVTTSGSAVLSIIVAGRQDIDDHYRIAISPSTGYTITRRTGTTSTNGSDAQVASGPVDADSPGVSQDYSIRVNVDVPAGAIQLVVNDQEKALATGQTIPFASNRYCGWRSSVSVNPPLLRYEVSALA